MSDTFSDPYDPFRRFDRRRELETEEEEERRRMRRIYNKTSWSGILGTPK